MVQAEQERLNNMADDLVAQARRQENEVYYKQIISYLEAKNSSNKTMPAPMERMIRKNASAYSLIDGVLYYGQRNQRKVIIDPLEQNRILSSFHLETSSRSEEDGAEKRHISNVKRMHRTICQLYYWRNCFGDICSFVASCRTCQQQSRKDEERRDALETEDRESGTKGGQRIWSKVEVRVFGPYAKTIPNGAEYILAVIDPVSRWIVAQAISAEHLADTVAHLVFTTFCSLGFARCVVVGFTKDLFNEVKESYKRLLEPGEVADLCLQESSVVCCWIEEILESYISGLSLEQSTQWDVRLSRFLYQYRTTALSELDNKSPFEVFHGRLPSLVVLEEDKASGKAKTSGQSEFLAPLPRRKLQSSTLECRHCRESFTSKISFRIHQRIHTEEARMRGIEEAESLASSSALGGTVDSATTHSPRSPVVSASRSKQLWGGRSASAAAVRNAAEVLRAREHRKRAVPDDDRKKEVMTRTLSRVRALITSKSLTSRHRARRRGKYLRVTSDQRSHIARYAMQHGVQQAASHFSTEYKVGLSVSTVRNFVKFFQKFPPDVAEEIGWFAHQYGIEVAARHFSKKLGHDVKLQVTRNFRKAFLRKNPSFDDSVIQGAVKATPQKRVKTLNRTPKAVADPSLAPELRREIGLYAVQHGAQSAAQHFGDKLRLAIREFYVRKCRREVQESEQLFQNQLNQQQQHHMQYGSQTQQQLPMNTNGSQQCMVTANTSNHHNMVGHPHQHQNNLNLLQSTHTHQEQQQIMISQQQSNTGLYDPQQPYSCHRVVELQPPASNYGNHGVNNVYLHQQYCQSEYEQTHDNSGVSMNQNNNAYMMGQQHLQHHNEQQVDTSMMNVIGQQNHMMYASGGATSSTDPTGLPYLGFDTPQEHQHHPVTSGVGSANSTAVLDHGMNKSHAQMGGHGNTNDVFSIHHQTNNELEGLQPLMPTMVSNGDVQTHLSQASYCHQTEVMSDGEVARLVDNSLRLLEERKAPTICNDDTENLHNTRLNTPAPVVERCDRLDSELKSDNRRSPERQASSVTEEIAVESEDLGSSAEPKTTAGNSPIKSVTTCKRRNPRRRATKGGKRFAAVQRGAYTTYAPEFRAKVGQYAARFGVPKALRHFVTEYGLELPESTVRGLRQAYLTAKGDSGTDEPLKEMLDYRRGRPTLLGKYDEIVMKILVDLQASGARLTPKIVLATSREVLTQYEPEILPEHGGKLQLTPAFARSMIRRMKRDTESQSATEELQSVPSMDSGNKSDN